MNNGRADSVRRALALLGRIAAHPRPAGSEAEADVRRFCAKELERSGFATREVPFSYSTVPGHWATPAGGVVSVLAVGYAGHVGFRGDAALALGVLVGSAAVLLLAGRWVARSGVLAITAGRATAVNLAATRGGESPRVWLVAHLDSKSQPVPIGLRAAGIMGSVVAWAAAIAAALVQVVGSPGAAALAQGSWPWIAGAALITGLPVIASFVGENSPGALDNASGVATVLMAAAKVPRHVPLGVLLTSAEELGLAGARAWATEAEPAIALNCDGVDDSGKLVCMKAGSSSGVRLLTEAVESGAAAEGIPLRIRRLIPGILVDAVALADSGWLAVTLSRGTVRTLSRIHGKGDTVSKLTGSGIASTAAVMAHAAAALAAGPGANR